MKAFAIAAIITSLAVPALAQGDPAKAEANKAEEQKKKESEQIERAYKEMLKRNNLSRKQTRGEIYASFPSRTREGPDRHLSRQDLALNLSAKRRLCNTVGGRVIEGCLYRKLDPAIMVMKSAEDGRRYNVAHVLNGAMDRSVLVERPMSPQLIIVGSILRQNPA